MADALSSLLSLSSNRTPTAYTPDIRRNNARTGALSRLLKVPDDGSISQMDMESAFDESQADQRAALMDEAEAQAIPEQVRGEYGLRAEQMRGASAERVAEANRRAAEDQKAALFAQQEYLTRLRGDQTAMNQSANREATAARAATTQAAQLQRQQLANLYSRRAAAQKEAQKVGAFGRLLGHDKRFTDEISSLDQQIAALGQQGSADGDFSPEEAAQALASRFPNASLEELMGRAEFDSPEEADAFAQALSALGYR